METADVVVIGGGAVGCCAALALSGLGFSVILLDAKPQVTHGTKNFALSLSSQRILTKLGVWSAELEQVPVTEVQVSEQGGFGSSYFKNTDFGIPALGFMCLESHLQQRIRATLSNQAKLKTYYASKVTHLKTGTNTKVVHLEDGRKLEAQFIIAADGVASPLRQSLNVAITEVPSTLKALITRIRVQKPKPGLALERFTQFGPLAVLPLSGAEYSVVFSLKQETEIPESAAQTQALLQEAIGWRLGQITDCLKPHYFPLNGLQISHPCQQQVLFLGSSAYHFHPVAGQGFNFALRCTERAARLLAEQGLVWVSLCR